MGRELESAKVEEILQGIRIPPQPQILVDIQMELAMPDSDVDGIAALIAHDVGLSGRILKIVNSPFFGVRNKIISIAQAISLLGINSVVNIVNALSLKDALSDDKVVALTGFWDSAVDTAEACAYVSKAISFSAPDEAYTLGLFHDCGIPLLMMRFDDYPNLLKQGYASYDKTICEVEQEALDTSHNVVGYYVARSWKLPEHLCDAIAEHHDCFNLFSDGSTKDSQKRNLLAILKLSEYLCADYRTIGDSEDDYEFQQLKQPLLHYLGISEIDMENLRDELMDQGIGG